MPAPHSHTGNPTRARGLFARASSLRAVAALVSAFGFLGCLAAPEAVTDAQPRVRVNLSLERPASSSMQLKTLHLVLQSNRGDILHDTITDEGGSLSGAHVVLNPPRHQGQILTPRYNLPPAEEWTLALRSYDLRDSLIHDEEHSIGALKAGEILDLPLRVGARVATYEGVFGPLPATFEGIDLTLQRFELDVDGQAHQASALTMEAGQPVRALYEYLPAGTREVHTRLYGTVGGDPTLRLLWEGREQLDIRADARGTLSVPLNWSLPANALGKAGADTETMNAQFILGRVGHVVMNVTIPSAVVL